MGNAETTYVGALRAEGDNLVLLTLRNAEEVLSAKDLPRPAVARRRRKNEYGQQLVELLKGEFDPKDYKDEYRARVMESSRRKQKVTSRDYNW